MNLGARSLRDLVAFRRLVRLIRRRHVDVVHAHLAYAAIWGTVAGRLLGVPVLATLHAAPPSARTGSREWLRQRLLVSLLNRWARPITVSEALREWWSEAGLDVGRIRVVHNGVPGHEIAAAVEATSRPEVRRRLGLPEGAAVVLTVAALRPGKGIGTAIEGFAEVRKRRPDARFLVVGDGPLRADLERRGTDVGGVRFLGYRSDVVPFLAAADLFVLASRDDAFPTAVLEAMAAGVPVVGSRSGGIPEIVDEGRTGLLVPPGEPAALGEAVAALLDDEVRRETMAAAARERVAARFSRQRWLEALVDLYREGER